MKKSIYALVFGIFILSSSCQKDIAVVPSKADDTPTTTSIQKGKSNTFTALSYSKQGDCSSGVYVENGMLVFTDANHFKTTLECLEQQVEDHNQAFENQYGYLSDDDISNILESTNFNEFQPLVDFESTLVDYKSLRNKVEGLVAKWLNKPDLDMNTYPRNVPVIGQGMRTLVNESYQVKVGNDILDFSTNNGGNNASLTASNSCGIAGFSGSERPFDNNNKKLVANSGLLPSLLGSIVDGEVYIYRKKTNGGWNRFSTKIQSQVVGTLRNFNCNFDHNFSKFDDVNNRSHVNPRYRAWFRPLLSANDNDLLLQVDLSKYSIYHSMHPNIWY